MKAFLVGWLLCSFVVFGISLYGTPATTNYCKSITSPITLNNIAAEKKVTVRQKLITISLGPIALGLLIPVILERQEENRYRLEELLGLVLEEMKQRDKVLKPKKEHGC